MQIPIFTFTLWAFIRDALDLQKEEPKVKKSITDTWASTVEGYTSLLPNPLPAPLAPWLSVVIASFA